MEKVLRGRRKTGVPCRTATPIPAPGYSWKKREGGKETAALHLDPNGMEKGGEKKKRKGSRPLSRRGGEERAFNRR